MIVFPQSFVDFLRFLWLSPQHGLAVLEADRDPQMTAVAEFFRFPHVGHEQIFGTTELLSELRIRHLIYISALPTERRLSTIAPTGIGQLCPRTEDILGSKETSGIRSPACTATRDHPVSAVLLEDCRCLVLSTGSHTISEEHTSELKTIMPIDYAV